MKARDMDIQNRRKLGSAFYALAHNDFRAFNALESHLQETDVGKICQEYIKTGDSGLIEKAGVLLAGKHWYVALGR